MDAPLRFLADECCDFAVVRALRTAGFDVIAASEITTRSIDGELIEQANRERRILLTEDKDFGWLVFVSHANSAGVILIRYPGNARTNLGTAVVRFIEEHQQDISDSFIVLQPGQIRISRKPE